MLERDGDTVVLSPSEIPRASLEEQLVYSFWSMNRIESMKVRSLLVMLSVMGCHRAGGEVNHDSRAQPISSRALDAGVRTERVADVDADTQSYSSGGCSSVSMAQPGMNECAREELKDAEAELSRMLGDIRLRHNRDKVFLSRFDKAQRAWLAFREAEVDSIYAHMESRSYGSDFPMCIDGRREAMTRKRMLELKPWIDGETGNEACTTEYP